MPVIKWKKVVRFFIILFLLIIVLELTASFFYLPIEIYVDNAAEHGDISFIDAIPKQFFNRGISSAYLDDLLKEGESTVKRSITINLAEKSALVDFSIQLINDSANRYLIEELTQSSMSWNEISTLIKAFFGQMSLDSRFLSENNFQSNSLDIDTKNNLLTVHFTVQKAIENTSTIRLHTSSSQLNRPLEIVLNFKGRILKGISPYPTETGDGVVKISGTSITSFAAETEVANSGSQGVPIAGILSQQELIKTLDQRVNPPFVNSILYAILDMLPLLVFVAFIWSWKGDQPKLLVLLSEIVLALLTYHFIYYSILAFLDLDLESLISSMSHEIDNLFNLVYKLFFKFPGTYVGTTYGIDIIVSTVLVGVLVPVILIRRSQEWGSFQQGSIELTDPFDKRSPAGQKHEKIHAGFLLTHLALIVLICLPVFFWLNGQFDFYTIPIPPEFTHILLVMFQVGVWGLVLVWLFRAIFIHLDGKPVPHTSIVLCLGMILLGCLILSLDFNYILNQKDFIISVIGWGWLVYATILGAMIVYGFLRVICSILNRANLIGEINPKIRAILIGFSIVSAIPMQVLFNNSINPATYYTVLSLFSYMDSIIPFIFLGVVVWFFYTEGKSESGPALSQKTLTVGLISATIILYNFSSNWLFIPITFLIGYKMLSYWIRPADYWAKLEPIFKRVFDERVSFLEEIVRLNTAERAYQKFYKKMSDDLSSGTIDYVQFKEKVESRRKELEVSNEAAKVGGKPIKDVALAFGPKSTAWENGMHGTFWAAIFALPWLGIWTFNFLSGGAYNTTYPLWSFLGSILHVLASWVGAGFVFGYFYPYLRGKDGLQKGLWFWVIIVLPALPLALINNSSLADWQGFLFWGLQMFIQSMLLGLVAFDYMTLRQGYQDWQMLFEVHGIPLVGASVSTILIAIGAAVVALIQTQASQMLTLAFQVIVPQIPTLDKIIQNSQNIQH